MIHEHEHKDYELQDIIVRSREDKLNQKLQIFLLHEGFIFTWLGSDKKSQPNSLNFEEGNANPLEYVCDC